MILSARGALTSMDAEYSDLAVWTVLVSPRPPMRTGRASRSRSFWGELRSVKDGINTSVPVVQEGSISASVLIKYLHRCFSPKLKAA